VTLLVVWFIIWGFLWAMYFMLDGYDLGAAAVMGLVGRSDRQREIIHQSIGPFWDGNEVWLIAVGGVTFAAFPAAYAVMFSTLYAPLLMILFALIFRALAFEFRPQSDSRHWRGLWDTLFSLSSIVAAFLFGVAFANIFRGVPFDAEGRMQAGLLDLLTPYALLGGVLFLLIFALHGSIWIAARTDGPLLSRARKAALALWPLVVLGVVAFLLASIRATPLYGNFVAQPILFAIPALAVVALVMVLISALKGRWWRAWFASAGFIAAVVFFGVAGLFPNIFPSSLDPAYNLTIENSASSPLTLKIMLAVTLLLVPLIVGYQIWVHLVFKGKLTEEPLERQDAY